MADKKEEGLICPDKLKTMINWIDSIIEEAVDSIFIENKPWPLAFGVPVQDQDGNPLGEAEIMITEHEFRKTLEAVKYLEG